MKLSERETFHHFMSTDCNILGKAEEDLSDKKAMQHVLVVWKINLLNFHVRKMGKRELHVRHTL